MTTANKVTIARILLVPFFIAQLLYYGNGAGELHRWLAIAAFALCALSDGIDGYLARHFNQRSELGTILDPAADKLLLVSGVVLLSFDHQPHLPKLPLWLVTTIVGRDVLLAMGAVLIHHTCGRVTVRPRVLGKIATVFQMAIVLWALLKWQPDWLDAIAAAAAVGTGFSGLLYVWDGVRQLNTSPRSHPTMPSPPG
jgi:cardiolipin synthase